MKGAPQAPPPRRRSRLDRLRLAAKRRPKRLLYPLLALGRGELRQPEEVELGGARRLLVLRELNTLGDSLVATPAVRALGRAHPGLELATVAGRRNAAVWRHNPHLERLFVLGGGLKPLRFAELVRSIREWGPDICLTVESLSCHATLDVLARMSGAPLRIRYDGAAFGAPHTNAAYTCLVPLPPACHQIDLCAGVLRPFGIETTDRTLELHTGPAAATAAARVLADAGLSRGSRGAAGGRAASGPIGAPADPAFVVVHPGSKQVHNRWPIERFLAVYDHCRTAHGLRTLLSFGPTEEPARAWFRARRVDARDLLPRLSLLELAALLRRARLLVCPDTGILHAGAAVGVPIVGLYGSGEPDAWQPPGAIRAVRSPTLGNVRDLTVRAVLREVDAALARAIGGAEVAGVPPPP